jgi:hypothetical protein
MEIYDKKYYLHNLSYSGTEIERELIAFRLSLIKKAVNWFEFSQTIVDYGCSHGAFLKGVKDSYSDFDVIGVDINPFCVSHCVMSGHNTLTPDMFDYFCHQPIGIMSFWDVFEHLPKPKDVLDRFKPEAICLSMPCLDGWNESHPDMNVQLWKHWKPLEHLWNFTLSQVTDYLSLCYYDVVYTTFDESKIRRDNTIGEKNIMSVVAKRRTL